MALCSSLRRCCCGSGIGAGLVTARFGNALHWAFTFETCLLMLFFACSSLDGCSDITVCECPCAAAGADAAAGPGAGYPDERQQDNSHHRRLPITSRWPNHGQSSRLCPQLCASEPATAKPWQPQPLTKPFDQLSFPRQLMTSDADRYSHSSMLYVQAHIAGKLEI